MQFSSPRYYFASATQYCSKTNDASRRLIRQTVWLLFNLGQLTLRRWITHICVKPTETCLRRYSANL
jgi:hypothetical protein